MPIAASSARRLSGWENTSEVRHRRRRRRRLRKFPFRLQRPSHSCKRLLLDLRQLWFRLTN